MDLSLGKLQQLITVARTGSFSKAASELSISQPALSRSIAAIEGRYGFQMFNRVGHGVQLTAAGAQVVEQAEPLLQTLRVFDNNLKLLGAGRAGVLSIGLSPLLASQLVAKFACEFVGSTANAQLKVMIHTGDGLVDNLKNDVLEMFFFPEGYIDPVPEIEIEAVGKISAVCVVRSGHPLAGRADLTLEDLAEFPWASAVDPPIDEKLLNPVRFTCDNYHILREAVQESDMICICSETFIEPQLAGGTLCEIQIAGLPLAATGIYVAKLAGRVNSPLAKAALQRMREYLL